MIGLITLDAKWAGARSAGNPHAACEVAGAGDGPTAWLVRHSQRKRGVTDRPGLRGAAPALDPTRSHNIRTVFPNRSSTPRLSPSYSATDCTGAPPCRKPDKAAAHRPERARQLWGMCLAVRPRQALLLPGHLTVPVVSSYPHYTISARCLQGKSPAAGLSTHAGNWPAPSPPFRCSHSARCSARTDAAATRGSQPPAHPPT
jgi:hypothetical protein